MEKSTAIIALEGLASGIRLDIYRLLLQRAPGGMVAGEIAAALDLPSTNLSFHLKALTSAGLATVEQEGRFQRYRANLPLMAELVAFLTAECCCGHPESCAELQGPTPARAEPRPKPSRASARRGR